MLRGRRVQRIDGMGGASVGMFRSCDARLEQIKARGVDAPDTPVAGAWVYTFMFAPSHPRGDH